MPRANRSYTAGLIWHVTHRCHKKEFLLRFDCDRRRWRHWLYVAQRRYGLCILNYIVTSNHVHLLVQDRGKGEIAKSMQLVGGRTAQEYNHRKRRRGAFWEDRYHATAVQSGDHLARCITYIDLNMVRADVVDHPLHWRFSGYYELCNPPRRKAVVDLERLCELQNAATLQSLHASRDEAIEESRLTSRREPVWTSAAAVGDTHFLVDVQRALGPAGLRKKIEPWRHGDCLREPHFRYFAEIRRKSAIKAPKSASFGAYSP